MSKLVSKTLSGLYNGVSQQAETLRLESQMAEQVNMEGTLIDGLFKRPGSKLTSVIGAWTKDKGVYFGHINRDAAEQYVYAITNAEIRIWDMEGNPQAVDYGVVNFDDYTYVPDDSVKTRYLAGTCPKLDFDTMTIADWTYLVNRNIECRMRTDVASGTVTKTYQSFSDLFGDKELVKTVDMIVKIEGDPENSNDEYYLTYTGDDVFVECPAPGVLLKMDERFMPHGLLKLNDRFVLTPLVWGEREVGDDKTNPIPSFIGTKIKHVFFFRNRLGFLTAQNFIMGRPSDYMEFFSTTAMEVLPTDPIDVNINSKVVTNLHKSEVFGRSLLLFSDQQQWTVHSGEALFGPDTIKIDPSTAYETDVASGTTNMGAFAYFCSSKGKFTDIMEYKVQADTLIDDAESTTAHVPKFIPTGLITMQSSPAEGLIAVHTSAMPNSLYIYRMKDVDQQRVQSSWSRWDFRGAIEGFTTLKGKMTLMMSYENFVVLEVINLEFIDTEGLTYTMCMDSLQTKRSYAYDADAKTAKIFMDTVFYDAIVVRKSNGRQLSRTHWVGNDIILEGVNGVEDYYVGVPVTGYVTLSPWYLKNTRQTTILEGRLQIRNIAVQYKNSGSFDIEITNKGREPRLVEWTNNIIGQVRIGEQRMQSGKFKTGVRGQNINTKIRIISNSYLPIQITAVGYEGAFTQRASIL